MTHVSALGTRLFLSLILFVFPTAYIQSLIDGADAVRSLLPDLAKAAEQAAPRLVSGGDLYIASVRPDFVSEGYIRSGGLMMLREYDPVDPPKQGDVVIFGWTGENGDQDQALLSLLRETGALIIGIGPDDGDFASQLDAFLPGCPPLHLRVLISLGNTSYPNVSLQNLILLWAFTGELVAALSRRRIMPVLYQSVLVPGARDRNASFGSRRFHPTHTVAPVDPGLIANAYLGGISTCLQSLLGEVVNLTQAVELCSETLDSGHRIHAFLISHFPVHQSGAPGDPGHMTPLEVVTGETPDRDELDHKLEPGDLFFFLGYYRRPITAYELARSRGCRIIEVITGDDTPLAGTEPDLVIKPGWHYTDALVDIPGYDIRILPSSGIIQSAVYWSIVGAITELSS